MEMPPGSIAARLSDLCVSIADGDHQAPPKSGQGVPFITISAMNDGTVDINKASRFVLRSYWSALSPERAPSRGDILVSVTGSIGIAAPVETDEPFVFQRHIALLRPDQRRVCRSYLLQCLRSRVVREQFKDIATGTAQLTIPLGGLRNVWIPLPPLAEQRRIAARIVALFAHTRRVRADLERVTPLAEKFREATTEKAYEPVPGRGWRTARLGDLTDLRSGVTLGKRYPEGADLVDRPYLRVANVQRGHLKLDEIKTIRLPQAEAKRLALQPGDILMNEGGDRDKLGRGWVWNGEVADCIHQNHVFRMRLKNQEVTPYFVSRYANHFGARYFLSEGKQTTNLASISMGKVAALPIPVPPPGVALRIDATLQAAEQSSRNLEGDAARALLLLDHLERSILARAFCGELIAQDPADEPAEVALARVKALAPVARAKPGRPRADLASPVMSIPKARGKQMLKSRADADVKGKAYLADRLRRIGPAASADNLYREADLPIADFYKQLSDEMAQGWIRDAGGKLETA
jgi:type I restriction enzyme S subunit